MQQVPRDPQMKAALAGARVLVLEDEFLLSLHLEMTLLDAGADTVAAARSVREGLAAVEKGGLDAAILDLRLGQESATPVARALAAKGVPFMFYTGQLGDDPDLREWPRRRVLSKPAQAETIVAAVAGLLRH
jgi:DNA-binding response OmpR family regulator